MYIVFNIGMSVWDIIETSERVHVNVNEWVIDLNKLLCMWPCKYYNRSRINELVGHHEEQFNIVCWIWINVLNFEKLVVQRISLLMFKYTHGNVPISVSQLFRTNNEYHNYNTRNCAHIHVPVGTTEASYRTFGYRGIYIWNHISQKININTSYPCFKNLVKIYIQNNNLDNIRLNYWNCMLFMLLVLIHILFWALSLH